MKQGNKLFGYAFLFTVLTFLDRITKSFMLWHGGNEISITPFLSFKLCMNRGISWGMLHSANDLRFLLVIVITVAVTCGLAVYMHRRWKRGQSILWETCALAGAVSNLFDRFAHKGVIDFITFSAGDWLFPSFNVADVCIVGGVFFMMLALMKNDTSSVQ